MFTAIASRVSGFVAEHDLLVIVLMLVCTSLVGAGMAQLDMEDQTEIDDDVFSQTTVGSALDYTNANYGNNSDETATSSVYYRPAEGNALSRSSLVGVLEFQQTVLEEPAVEDELVDGSALRGPPNRIGEQLAGGEATIEEQIAAIKSASDRELRDATATALADPDFVRIFLPASYEPGTATADSLRVHFEFEQAAVTQQQEPLPNDAAQRVLYQTAQEDNSFFTMGAHAQAEWEQQQIADVLWLIVPLALALVLVVLAFAYRDIVDVLVGFFGVCVALVWFFGILGWLGIPAGFTSIVGPVLIVALSIDFGIHVFMRYREQRDPTESIRDPMSRSTRSVLVAFLLVAVTAAVGFLANVTSPIGFIRAFGVVITLGVFAAVVIFVTLVPALKIRVDSTLEGFGFDRRKAALGRGGRLKALLGLGVDLAQRAAPLVLVVAVLVGGIGVVSYTEIDRQGFQEDFADEGDWQTELPDPVGWSAHETEYRQHLDYVQAQYQSTFERDRATSLLIRGDVTDVTVLERIRVGEQSADEREITFKQGGTVPAVSPLSVMRNVAVENPEFAGLLKTVAAENEVFDEVLSETTQNHPEFATAISNAQPTTTQLADRPDDLSAVYDALYEIAPEQTATVLERENGIYRSMRLILPVKQGLDVNKQGTTMHEIADETAGETELSVVPVGFATVSNAGLGAIADSILQTMLVAFAGVAIVLAGMYHVERDAASLGAVTVIPIALVIGLVFGGMVLFAVPLTFITAFLASITVGLGIDYNIHISDRFAQELDRGRDPVDALYETVTGTGGALFGSALTSGVSFATLLIHPSALFQSFGFIVVLALLLSFAVSVLVLPSLLLVWANWTGATEDN
jgi:predicted RND superfamily exporter protein